MKRANGVQKTRVLCARINHRGHPQLSNARKSLHKGMANNVEYQPTWYLNEAKNGVVDYLYVTH